MEEELFFIVFMIAANAILWTWQFVSYKLEERGSMKTMLTNRLSHVLEVVFKEIKLCYYRIDQVTKEEYVRVLLRREYCGNADFFDICVTADSETALIDDVWKECKRRFA